MNNRNNPVAVSTGQSITCSSNARPVATMSSLTPHSHHKKSYSRQETSSSGLLHDSVNVNHMNVLKTGKSQITTTTPAILRNPGNAQTSSVIRHHKQQVPDSIQRLLVLPYSTSLERLNQDLQEESDRQLETNVEEHDKNVLIDDTWTMSPSKSSYAQPQNATTPLHKNTTGYLLAPQTTNPGLRSPSPHHTHTNTHLTIDDDDVSNMHSFSRNSCRSMQGVRPAEAYLYEYKDTKIQAEKQKKEGKSLQFLGINKPIDISFGESDEENENETRKVRNIFSTTKGHPLNTPHTLLLKPSTLTTNATTISLPQSNLSGGHSTIEEATHRYLSDENSILSNQLKQTQAEQLQVHENFQRIYATYAEHQSHIEHILEVIDKKDVKLKKRRHQIVNLRGVVENLSKEKIALLVQVNERGKKLLSAEHANMQLDKKNKHQQQEISNVQGKLQNNGEFVYNERMQKKDEKQLHEENQELSRQMQLLRVELLTLQQTHNLALRDHSKYEQDSLLLQGKQNVELAVRRDKIDSFQETVVNLQNTQIEQLNNIRALQEQLALLQEKEVKSKKIIEEQASLVLKLQDEQSAYLLSRDNALLKAKSASASLTHAEDKIQTLSNDNENLMREMSTIRQQLKMSNDTRRSAEQQYRLHIHEKTNNMQTQASLEGELEALRLQYEALKSNYAVVCSNLQEYKKELFKLQKDNEEYTKIKQAYELSSVEQKNLTMKLKEQKANSDAQVFALTESRDKYLLKLEMLRTVNTQLTQTVENQKIDVKQMTNNVATLDKDQRQAIVRKESLEVANKSVEEVSMLRELLNNANKKVILQESRIKTLELGPTDPENAVNTPTSGRDSPKGDSAVEAANNRASLEMQLAMLSAQYAGECQTTIHLRREETHLQGVIEALQKKLQEEKTNLANAKQEAASRIDLLHRKISDQDLLISKYRRQTLSDPV